LQYHKDQALNFVCKVDRNEKGLLIFYKEKLSEKTKFKKWKITIYNNVLIFLALLIDEFRCIILNCIKYLYII